MPCFQILQNQSPSWRIYIWQAEHLVESLQRELTVKRQEADSLAGMFRPIDILFRTTINSGDL